MNAKEFFVRTAMMLNLEREARSTRALADEYEHSPLRFQKLTAEAEKIQAKADLFRFGLYAEIDKVLAIQEKGGKSLEILAKECGVVQDI